MKRSHLRTPAYKNWVKQVRRADQMAEHKDRDAESSDDGYEEITSVTANLGEVMIMGVTTRNCFRRKPKSNIK